MNAHLIVDQLLEGDEIDPKAFATREDFEKAPMHMTMSDVPGATRRKGEGYSDQWEIPYKDWLFVVSFYEDGTQIWSAYYKGRLYGFDTETAKDRKRGFVWAGGAEPVKLPAETDPRSYLARLQKMADQHSSESIYRSRHIPHMPDADGPQRWQGNY
jgi:hypothetical protein